MSALRALLLCALASPAFAQQTPVAFTNARIIPIAGPEIDRGTVLVQDGKITAVGADVAVPAGAQTIDLAGKTIMPGLVDTHSHVGGPSGGDGSSPIQPDCRVLDSINARDSGFQKAQAGGVTVANVMSGSGHLLSGQTVYLKFRDGQTIDDLLFRLPDGSIAGGIKMANGTNSIRPGGGNGFPGTRAKSAALVREQFVKAQEYRDKVKRAAGDASKLPPRDLGLEAIVDVLERRRVVHHHTHRADDILTVLRLSREFGFKVVLHHVSEGWKVAEQIAAAEAPCSVIVIDAPGGKPEAQDLSLDTGRILDEAGALVGFHTDDGINDSRVFLRSAAMAVRAGMSRDAALKAMTINGAVMLDLQDRVGTIEPGKDADLIVLSGDPLSVYTHVLQTWVDGRKVFDRSDPKDYLFAVGGYGASKDQVIHTDCYHDDGFHADGHSK
jgi:imidazolonepropionase-like amidohydrolase